MSGVVSIVPSMLGTPVEGRDSTGSRPAYEKRSIAFSSNLHPAGFDELMPKTLATATATATVDRLLHHAHVCQTSGESVRLTQALAGQGVTPMS